VTKHRKRKITAFSVFPAAGYFLSLLLTKMLMRSLFLPIKSPINAPEIKQIIRLVIAKKSSPIAFATWGWSPVAFRRRTITAQMLKPMMDAPTKMNVALLVVGMVEELSLM
jgi:hypothetical protein